VPRNWTTKFRRAFTPCLLAVLQVNLLGIAILHQHGETISQSHAPYVSGCEVPTSPFADGNLFCTVCQIVQHGAVQPANAAQVIPLSTSVQLVRSVAPSHYHSEFPAMSYGRAPPLA
jgi:hypothetical protein